MAGKNDGMGAHSRPGVVVLDVSDHCVETEAKARYRAQVDALLAKEEASAEEEEAVEVLEHFLRTADFRALRGDHPELAGGTRGTVLLWREDGHEVRWAYEPGDAV